jgi:hypothetical protein
MRGAKRTSQGRRQKPRNAEPHWPGRNAWSAANRSNPPACPRAFAQTAAVKSIIARRPPGYVHDVCGVHFPGLIGLDHFARAGHSDCYQTPFATPLIQDNESWIYNFDPAWAAEFRVADSASLDRS